MWITSYLTKNREVQTATSGRVMNADSAGVEVSASRKYRELPVTAPYGICWVPPEGEQAVMVHTNAGDLCVGVVTYANEELEPGELMLCSEGGASIVLKNNGDVLINGKKYGGT